MAVYIFGAMEVNTNPIKILDHCMIVKVVQRDCIIDPNELQNFLIESASVLPQSRKCSTLTDNFSPILETPWTSGRKVRRARDWRFLFVGLVWEDGGAPCDVVVFQRYANCFGGPSKYAWVAGYTQGNG